MKKQYHLKFTATANPEKLRQLQIKMSEKVEEMAGELGVETIIEINRISENENLTIFKTIVNEGVNSHNQKGPEQKP